MRFGLVLVLGFLRMDGFSVYTHKLRFFFFCEGRKMTKRFSCFYYSGGSKSNRHVIAIITVYYFDRGIEEKFCGTLKSFLLMEVYTIYYH